MWYGTIEFQNICIPTWVNILDKWYNDVSLYISLPVIMQYDIIQAYYANNVFYYVSDIGANLTGNTFKNLTIFYYSTYKMLTSNLLYDELCFIWINKKKNICKTQIRVRPQICVLPSNLCPIITSYSDPCPSKALSPQICVLWCHTQIYVLSKTHLRSVSSDGILRYSEIC